MTRTTEFAILAPVPLEHIQSGIQMAEDTGFVALGSPKWELFRSVSERRGGLAVPALIYAPHEHLPAKDTFVICWAGWYVGSEETANGYHPAGIAERPPTTNTNANQFAVFWHVRDLIELPPVQHLPNSALQTIKGGWRKSVPPRGPELVAIPSTIEFPL